MSSRDADGCIRAATNVAARDMPNARVDLPGAPQKIVPLNVSPTRPAASTRGKTDHVNGALFCAYS